MPTLQKPNSPGTKEAFSAQRSEISVQSILNAIPYVLCLGFFLYHWNVICTWAIDVPFWDEWDEFPQHPLLQWVFIPHNEHRIVTTKLFALLLWQINGWDIAVHQILNFGIFGITLLTLGLVLRRSVRVFPAPIIALALMYCLSPRANENHLWGYQTQWHFMLLFSFLGAYLWFSAPQQVQNWRNLLLGSFCLVLAEYSLSGGLAVAATLVLVFTVFKLRRAAGNSLSRKREWVQWAGAALPVLLGVGLHFATIVPDPNAIAKTFPFKPEFWAHFLTLVGSGDCQRFSPLVNELVGGVVLALIVAAWVYLVRTRLVRKRTVPSELWVLAAITFGLLGALFSISIGRAALGSEQGLESRYTEFTMMLVPLTLAVWWWVLDPKPIVRGGAFVVAGLVLAICFCSSFWYFQAYSLNYGIRNESLGILRNAYVSGQPFYTPLYPKALPPERLQEAKKMQLSFIKRLQG